MLPWFFHKSLTLWYKSKDTKTVTRTIEKRNIFEYIERNDEDKQQVRDEQDFMFVKHSKNIIQEDHIWNFKL